MGVLTTDKVQGWVIESYLRTERKRRIEDNIIYNIIYKLKSDNISCL